MSIIGQAEMPIPAFLKGNGDALPIAHPHDSDLRQSLQGNGRTLAEFSPKRKPAPMNEITTIEPADEHEEAVTKAAAFFANHKREMVDLKARLENYLVACRERDATIDQLTISLEQERTRSVHLQHERDDAIGDRAMLEALFVSVKIQIDAFSLKLPQQVIPPRGADGRHQLEPVTVVAALGETATETEKISGAAMVRELEGMVAGEHEGER